jgi:putative ABC transport system permease protein
MGRMFLAAKEMHRGKVKFALLLVAVSLLVFLILVQQALSRALVTSFIGAIENQSAPVLVYATDALRAPLGSVITPDMEQLVVDSPEVAAAGRIGILPVTLEETALSEGEELSAVIWGFEDEALGAPAALRDGEYPATAGEAVGSYGDFELGETLTLAGPSGEEMEIAVVGLATDSQLAVQPTLFMDYADFESATLLGNPTAMGVLPSLMAVEPATDAAATVEDLRAASVDLDPLTREDAAAEFPGVAPVEQSFLIILALYGFVVPLVTGLFFLIITFQKTRALTLLRAVGARSGVLVRSLLWQVAFILGGGIAVGVGLYALTSLIEIGTLTIVFDWSMVAFWAILLGVLGVLSALASIRRVLAIDPVEATTGGGH